MGNPKIKVIDCGMVHNVTEDLGLSWIFSGSATVSASAASPVSTWNIPTEANLELFMELQR